MREMTEAERDRVTAEIAADPEQLADLMADRMPLALRRWMLDRAVAGADTSVPNADGRDNIVERLQTALLHPAASEHLDTALDLFRNDVASSTTAKALNALAATGGGRAAN